MAAATEAPDEPPPPVRRGWTVFVSVPDLATGSTDFLAVCFRDTLDSPSDLRVPGAGPPSSLYSSALRIRSRAQPVRKEYREIRCIRSGFGGYTRKQEPRMDVDLLFCAEPGPAGKTQKWPPGKANQRHNRKMRRRDEKREKTPDFVLTRHGDPTRRGRVHGLCVLAFDLIEKLLVVQLVWPVAVPHKFGLLAGFVV